MHTDLLVKQRVQTGNRLAEQAAEMERGGYFSTASLLWSNSANFPCKPLNREWRLNRAHSCSSLSDLRPETEVAE